MEDNFDSMLNVSAVPHDDRVAAFIAESKNNRNRCYDMSEQMTAEVATNGDSFQKYLDMQSHFERYTANNVLLIMAQNPDAQKIGDYSYWRDKGAYVKRQEKGNPILILEPGKEYEREDGSIGTYYNAKKLYDISQTTIREMAQPQEKITDEQLVRAVVNNPPVAIVPAEPDQMPKDIGAVFEQDEDCIYVRKGMDAQQIFQSIVPELVFAGFAGGNKNYERNEDAFHAYCATYILCKKYSVDTKGFDFSHVAEFFEGMEPQEVRGELSKVRNAANDISSRMEKALDRNRNQFRKHPVPSQSKDEKAEDR